VTLGGHTVEHMRLTLLDVLVGLVVLALFGVAFFDWGRSGARGVVVLASPTLTPGALNKAVTQRTIGSTICVRGWTATVRPPTSYTSELKAQQLGAYGLGGAPSAYQDDHLISLALGGDPTDPRNLWPEPYPRAAQVDKLENELNAKVCSGELSLATAQWQERALKHEHG
jgi:hypothetical protein